MAEAKATVDKLAKKAGPAQPQYETYTVKKGDNLTKIGQK